MRTRTNKTGKPAKKSVYFLNGPNANLYGLTDKGTYGSDTYASLQSRCEAEAKRLSIALAFLRMNRVDEADRTIAEAAQLAASGIVDPYNFVLSGENESPNSPLLYGRLMGLETIPVLLSKSKRVRILVELFVPTPLPLNATLNPSGENLISPLAFILEVHDT